MTLIDCPYCHETAERPSDDAFLACPQCGYRFARLQTGGDRYLIIDSRLPDLMDRFQELCLQENRALILIDRRVSQIAIAGNDRRR